MRWEPTPREKLVQTVGGDHTLSLLAQVNLACTNEGGRGAILDQWAKEESLILEPIRKHVLGALRFWDGWKKLKYAEGEIAAVEREVAVLQAKLKELQGRREGLVASQPAGLGKRLAEIDKQIAEAAGSLSTKRRELDAPRMLLGEAHTELSVLVDTMLAREVEKLVPEIERRCKEAEQALCDAVGPFIADVLSVDRVRVRLHYMRNGKATPGMFGITPDMIAAIEPLEPPPIDVPNEPASVEEPVGASAAS